MMLCPKHCFNMLPVLPACDGNVNHIGERERFNNTCRIIPMCFIMLVYYSLMVLDFQVSKLVSELRFVDF